MKANAPEKIYINPLPNHSDGYVGVAWNEPHKTMVEYTRTDAFIEKACEWFRRIDYDDTMPPYETTEEFIEGFKKAMKGE